jgi:hypothetical protein
MLIQFDRYTRDELARLVNLFAAQPGRQYRRAVRSTGTPVYSTWTTQANYTVHILDLICTGYDDAPFDVFAMICPFPPPPDITVDEKEADAAFLYGNCLAAWERRCEWWLGNTEDGFDALNKWFAAVNDETVSVEVSGADVLAEFDRRYPQQ